MTSDDQSFLLFIVSITTIQTHIINENNFKFNSKGLKKILFTAIHNKQIKVRIEFYYSSNLHVISYKLKGQLQILRMKRPIVFFFFESVKKEECYYIVKYPWKYLCFSIHALIISYYNSSVQITT